MEVTGDVDISRSLQLVAKANIIVTTVRMQIDQITYQILKGNSFVDSSFE